MTIDIKAMLRRVVAEVFDENFAVANVSSSDDSWLHGVHVSNCADKDRTAIIRASYGWMDALVPELDVQTILLDEDDVEAEKEAGLEGSASSCVLTFKGKVASNSGGGSSAGVRSRS